MVCALWIKTFTPFFAWFDLVSDCSQHSCRVVSHTQHGSSQVDRDRPFRQMTAEVDTYSGPFASPTRFAEPKFKDCLDHIARRCVSRTGVYAHGSVAYKALHELRWQSKRATGVSRLFVQKWGPAHPASKCTLCSDSSLWLRQKNTGDLSYLSPTPLRRKPLGLSHLHCLTLFVTRETWPKHNTHKSAHVFAKYAAVLGLGHVVY